MSGAYVEGSYYFYAPNKGAPVFFGFAFFLSGVIHLLQTGHYQCWKLTPLFPFCCLLFTVGFVLREFGAFNYDNLPVYIASICITYASPPLLELQNYHILGRVLYYVPYLSPLHPGRVLTTFGFLSAIVEALNGWGASYSANQSLSDNEMAAGHALIKSSLILQVFVLISFIVLAYTFHRRCKANGIQSPKLRGPLLTLYASSALLSVRTTYRIVEYFSIAELKYNKPNFNPMSMSPIVRYEWYFYVFEAGVMICNCGLFNIRHPRRYLPKNSKTYLAKDGITETEGPGFKDVRPIWKTLIDPFNIIGLFKGQNEDRSWLSDIDDNPTTNDKSAYDKSAV